MSKQKITTINGVEIYAETTENGIFVPIKPICEALGIAFERQYSKLQEDDILSSVVTLTVTTGAGGENREMVCLPLEYVYGWLFTINPKNVAESARESVTRYRRECYDALYGHFAGRMRRAEEQARLEADILRRKTALLEKIKAGMAEVRNLDSRLESLAKERTCDQPDMFNGSY